MNANAVSHSSLRCPWARKRASGHVIVNIGSISADQGYSITPVYAASKPAAVALSEGQP